MYFFSRTCLSNLFEGAEKTMAQYYRNTENGKVLTEDQYKEIKDQMGHFQKVSDDQLNKSEMLMAKIASGDLNDYSSFYEMEDLALDPNIEVEPENTLIVINMAEDVHCLEVFNKLKRNDLKPDVEVQQVMLAQRAFDERGFTVMDFENLSGEKNEWRDSILGIIIGFIGGPLGAIFGWAIGDVIGFGQAHHAEKKSENVFHYIANCIPEGQEGVLAIVKEMDAKKLNDLITVEFGGTIERFELNHINEAIKSIKK